MSTYGGYIQIQNLTGVNITNASAMHNSSSGGNATETADNMSAGQNSGTKSFTTSTSATDYWYVAFLDDSGNLLTGNTSYGFHSGDNGSTVGIQLYPTYFVVSFPNSGDSSNIEYDQI